MELQTFDIAALAENGYALCTGALDFESLQRLGRPSAPETVTARHTSSARLGSLSANYGFGEFAWHTDGAIALAPPRWAVLRAIRLSDPTWTELLDPSPGMMALRS